MRNLILSTLLMLFAFAPIFSQKDPIKWGKVPSEDLSMTEYAPDQQAGAVVLCDYGNIDFFYDASGVGYRFTRHKRVKILKRTGYDQANVKVPYYKSQSFTNLKAQIFAPDGSKVTLNKKEVFDEKVNDFVKQKRFTFPNVQEGSVIEYTYSIKSGNLFNLREWYFQDYIPVRWSELRSEMLSYYYYSTIMRGGLSPVVNEQSNGSKTLTSGTVVPTTVSRWVVENAPAMRKEPYSASPNSYRSKMQFQLISINIPGKASETIEWPDLVDDLQESTYFGEQYLRKTMRWRVVKAAEPEVAKAATPLAKAHAAYDFVNRKVKWNGYHWYDTFGSLDEVLKEGEGYSGELNLMVLALLKAEGIEAYPVLISTRSNGKVNPYYPLMAQFNHTLVWAKIDGKEYWIDAGDPLLPFGLPSAKSLNGQGLKILDAESQFEWIELVPKKAADVIFTTAEVNEDGTIKASIKTSHSTYSALSERKDCNNSTAVKHWQGRLTARHPDAEVTDAKLNNEAELSKKLKGEITVNIPDAAMSSGDLMYLSPIIWSNNFENPLKSEVRTLPVEFSFPISEQLITNLTFPEGYLVDGLPESVRLVLPENGGSFSYQASEAGGKIQLTIKLDLKKTFFLANEYEGLRNFFSLVEEKMAEQIVLKKQT